MEQVVLVDDQNNQIGLADKATVHTDHTPLHRGFSLFLFNSQGELLLTQRALSKKTFAGIWTNTVCGHPGPKERMEEAAQRRLREELGIREIREIREISPYKYKFADKSGIVENEICPILVGYYDGEVKPNPVEIENYKWIKWEKWLEETKTNPYGYSPWSVEETTILQALHFQPLYL